MAPETLEFAGQGQLKAAGAPAAGAEQRAASADQDPPRADRGTRGVRRPAAEDADELLAAAVERTEGQSSRDIAAEERPQGPARRRAHARSQSRRDARGLRRDMLLRRNTLAGQSAARLRLRPHRFAADQAHHDADQSAQGPLPMLQDARRRETARRHDARQSVRSRYRLARDLSARLPDGQLQSHDRGARRPVRLETLRGRHRQHVNRRPIGTPDRHPKGTPSSYVWND